MRRGRMADGTITDFLLRLVEEREGEETTTRATELPRGTDKVRDVKEYCAIAKEYYRKSTSEK